MRARSTMLAVSLVALCALTPATATAAVNPGCLADPRIGPSIFDEDIPPTLYDQNKQVALALFSGVLLADCPNTSVTAVTPGGGVINVPLNQDFPDAPPELPFRLGGILTVPLSYGAGVWHLTKITSGGTSKALHHPFEVRRAGSVTLNQPAVTTAPNQVTVSGSVKHYTSTGALVAVPNIRVTLKQSVPGFPNLKYLMTNSAGNFSGTLPLAPGSTTLRASASSATHYYAESSDRNTTVNQPLPASMSLGSIQASATAYVNQWWRVDAKTTPGTQWTDLQKPTTAGWLTTGSFGYSASNGTFTRWWKPTSAGSYNLRVRAGHGSKTVYHSFPITVKSKQTIPTYVDGALAPTYGGKIYWGTPMTAYGHLKVRYSNGTVGPYAGQRMLIQTKPDNDTTWYTRTTSTVTSSTGYFVAHFDMPYKVKTDVRFLFLSPYVTIKNGSLSKPDITVNP